MAPVAELLEVPVDDLRRRLSPEDLPFETTAEVEPLEDTIGQDRALEAIEFGLEIESRGYNLFVTGPSGSGRESTVRAHLERMSADRPVPDDWVYVHDFEDPDRPRAIRLPAGHGRELAGHMKRLVERAGEEIPKAFESEEFTRAREQAVAEQARRTEALTQELEDFARERDFATQTTPAGIVQVPLRDGRPVPPQELQRLPQEEREAIERRGEEVNERFESGVRELRRLEKEAAERTGELGGEVARRTVGPHLEELREKYRDQREVVAFLDQVERDVPEHIAELRPAQDAQGEEQPIARLREAQREEQLARYQVNLVVDNSRADGAPIVVERNPTYYNLIGRLEYRPAFGTMVTDLREIKSGALQRANGGFLVLDAFELLRQPFSWQALKRALSSGEARIENLAEQLSPVPTATLHPEPIPLELKIVLIGPPLLYQLLHALDEGFDELFKVKVEFGPDMDWTEGHAGNYARFISRCVRQERLRHFDRAAVARVVEQGARLREHQRKLSTRLREISDVVCEAGFWAHRSGHEHVGVEDVERAISTHEHRSNMLEERVHELLREGTLMIDTRGARTGQVNGLALADVGNYSFGRPTRVTARVRAGDGTVASIEREIELSDPIHSKAFLTLSGFLAERYAPDLPLALRATIALEQSYDEVGGDSASAAELYALLSALAGLPLDQGIAVTGSVNQHGDLQAVGGVTRKIEGFFAACAQEGLTGAQGVLIPGANVRHLMLAEDVLGAVRDGDFHVWAAGTIDEGIELLAGRPAGERSDGGCYPEGSINRLVEDRLRHFADSLRSFALPGDGQPARPR